jgi:hypothetical protein
MGVVALGFMVALGFISLEGWTLTFKEMDSNSIIQLYHLIIVAPIAFIVWVFRDQNHLRTLSNARKDTNLKEFQQLQSGQQNLARQKTTKPYKYLPYTRLEATLKVNMAKIFAVVHLRFLPPPCAHNTKIY